MATESKRARYIIGVPFALVCAVLPCMAEAQTALPRVVCTEGPSTLWASPDRGAAPMGVVTYRTAVSRVDERPERARVSFPGLGVRSYTWIDRDAVGAFVTQPARVRGAPISVRAGDLVCVRNENAGAGRAQILVRTRLHEGFRFDAVAGLEAQNGEGQVWVGTYPQSGLQGVPPSSAGSEESPPWQRFSAAHNNAPAEVFDAPNGARILTVDPSTDVPVSVVLHDGPWRAVRIGEGPFVLGFTRAELVTGENLRESARAQAMALALSSSGGSSSGSFVNARAGDPSGGVGRPSVPAVLHSVETNLPLRTLRAGASVRLVGGERLTPSGNVVMRVGALDADIGEVRVLVPLSEGVALYGYVRPGDLQPL